MYLIACAAPENIAVLVYDLQNKLFSLTGRPEALAVPAFLPLFFTGEKPLPPDDLSGRLTDPGSSFDCLQWRSDGLWWKARNPLWQKARRLKVFGEPATGFFTPFSGFLILPTLDSFRFEPSQQILDMARQRPKWRTSALVCHKVNSAQENQRITAVAWQELWRIKLKKGSKSLLDK